MMKLLYFEAKDNILRGRYPVSQEDCDRMAGLQAVITQKESTEELNADFGTAAYFKYGVYSVDL